MKYQFANYRPQSKSLDLFIGTSSIRIAKSSFDMLHYELFGNDYNSCLLQYNIYNSLVSKLECVNRLNHKLESVITDGLDLSIEKVDEMISLIDNILCNDNI